MASGDVGAATLCAKEGVPAVYTTTRPQGSGVLAPVAGSENGVSATLGCVCRNSAGAASIAPVSIICINCDWESSGSQ